MRFLGPMTPFEVPLFTAATAIAAAPSTTIPTTRRAIHALDARAPTAREDIGPSARAAGRHVEADVLDRQRAWDRAEYRVEERLVEVLRQALEMPREDHGGKKGAGIAGCHGPRLEPDPNRLEPGALEPQLGVAHAGVVPRPLLGSQVRGEPLVATQRVEHALDLADVPLAAALRLELAAESQRREEALEEQIVPEDPMEGGGGEDGVDGLVEVEAEQV